MELTSEGKAILGLTQSDVAYHAFQGVAPFFKPHKQIRAVCGAHNLDLWIVARKNSGIVNIFDLQGKRIAMGATGGESVIIAKALLEAHGIHEGDYRPFYLSISNAVHSMRNSEIDLIFYLSNGPGSALAELFEEVEIRILGIDSRYLNSILKNHPYWKQSTIKQNIWSELDHDIHTLGTPTPLITHQDVPDKLIRKITAAIMEHAADADNLHVNHSRIDSILVEKMELASGRLIAWGNVVETAVIDRLIKLKVDTIGSDHALPQKASKTRSKLYAGKGAFLAMWTYRYPAMIQELRENFPEAELALVPPIKNPKGGVLGLSVVPGYRPLKTISRNQAHT